MEKQAEPQPGPPFWTHNTLAKQQKQQGRVHLQTQALQRVTVGAEEVTEGPQSKQQEEAVLYLLVSSQLFSARSQK